MDGTELYATSHCGKWYPGTEQHSTTNGCGTTIYIGISEYGRRRFLFTLHNNMETLMGQPVEMVRG